MKMFQPYRPTDGFYYRMTPHCVFCSGKTDRMKVYAYHGVELDEREFPIPVHPFCYLRKKAGVWTVAVLLFAVVFIGAVLLASGWLGAVPFWLMMLNGFVALGVAGYGGLKRFSAFEHEIARYKRSHTDYEDHYKSDYRRRAGFKNW